MNMWMSVNLNPFLVRKSFRIYTNPTVNYSFNFETTLDTSTETLQLLSLLSIFIVKIIPNGNRIKIENFHVSKKKNLKTSSQFTVSSSLSFPEE